MVYLGGPPGRLAGSWGPPGRLMVVEGGTTWESPKPVFLTVFCDFEPNLAFGSEFHPPKVPVFFNSASIKKKFDPLGAKFVERWPPDKQTNTRTKIE